MPEMQMGRIVVFIWQLSKVGDVVKCYWVQSICRESEVGSRLIDDILALDVYFALKFSMDIVNDVGE